jgi:hypothetical protein
MGTPMSASYLLDAGWLFFALWGGVLLFVSFKAFGRDFFGAGDHHEPRPTLRIAKSGPPGEP